MTLENHSAPGGLSPDDSRLSAYAFGELEGEELAAIEAAIAKDPALATRVAELREFGAEIGASLAAEPESVPARPSGAKRVDTAAGGRILRFPAWFWAGAGFAAAASVAVMVMREDATITPGVRAIEMALEPAKPREMQAETRASSAEDNTVAFQPAAPLRVADTVRAPEDVATLLREGRKFYAKGDLTSAEETFREAGVVDPGNAEAKYFTERIAKDREIGGVLTGARITAGSVETVAHSWQRPGVYADAAASAPSVSGGVTVEGTWSGPVDSRAPSEYVFRDSETSGSAPATPIYHADARRLGAVAGETRRRVALRNQAEASPAVAAESYVGVRENSAMRAADEPLSTFSIDVDTASYANVRRFIQSGSLPPRDAVRIEELINYFPYRYTAPVEALASQDATPFSASLAVVSAPWAPERRLVRIGIKGRDIDAAARPPANLVFLVDVSGSMSATNKLPLVKSSLRLLLGRLRSDDRVAIVTYAGATSLSLPSTPVAKRNEIMQAIEDLKASGSTNGGMGIHLAYDIAKANFRPEGVNRVILCTDGDFNVGVTDRGQFLELIQEKAKSRVFLTVLGFGMGNLKDGTLELLANKGDGAYGYIDSEREARKTFVDQLSGTLVTIAKDVKVQVEFNPAKVESYRLVGYENRLLAKEDFNNDKVDAGEIGAGHTVTALYEIVPIGGGGGARDGENRPVVDPLKYGAESRAKTPPAPVAGASDELLTVKIRYKAPLGDESRKLEFPLVDRGAGFSSADPEFKFAAAVAAWGMVLRESPNTGDTSFADILAWAEDGLVGDDAGHRAEFIELVRSSEKLRAADRR